MHVNRILLDADPFHRVGVPLWQRGRWPAAWVADPGGEGARLVAFRCIFTVAEATTWRVHLAADERYRLFVDGQRVGDGSERDGSDRWRFDTYDLHLPPGEHVVVAWVWWQAPAGAHAMRAGHGLAFLCAGEDGAHQHLSTGTAVWTCHRASGLTWHKPVVMWGAGARVEIDGRTWPWGLDGGHGDDWKPVLMREQGQPVHSDGPVQAAGRPLAPARLPSLVGATLTAGRVVHLDATAAVDALSPANDPNQHLPEEAAAWDALLARGVAVTLPAHSRRRVLIDLAAYRLSLIHI
jgi:alpha-L-rhamnosidase